MKNVIGKIVRLSAIACVCGSLSAFSAFGDGPCEVNGTSYPTLEAAVAAAPEDGVVQIMMACTLGLSKPLVIDKSVTIEAWVGGVVIAAASDFEGDCMFKVCNGAALTLDSLTFVASGANEGRTITCPTGDVVPYGGTRCFSCEGSGSLTMIGSCWINQGCSVNGAIVLAKDFTGEILFDGMQWAEVTTQGSGGLVAVEGQSDVDVTFENCIIAMEGSTVCGNGGVVAAFGESKVDLVFNSPVMYDHVVDVGGNGGLFYFGKNVSGSVEIYNACFGWDNTWRGCIDNLMQSQAYDPRQSSWRSAWTSTVYNSCKSGPTRINTVSGVGDLGFWWNNGHVSVRMDGLAYPNVECPCDNAQYNYSLFRCVSSTDRTLAADYAARNAAAGDVANLTVPANDPAVFGTDGLYREIDAAITDNGMLEQHVTLECPSRSAIALAYLYGEGDPSPVNTVVINVTDSAYDKGLYLNGFYEKSSVPNGAGGLTKTFVRYVGASRAKLVSESGEITFATDLRTGMRTIESLDEILPFTHSVNAWGEASAAASATITWSNSSFSFQPQLMGTYADGDVVTWVPNGNGTYIFKHEPGSGLTATFNVDIPFTGSGTEEDPYVVTSAKGLSVVAKLGGWVRLGANIISNATLPADLALYLDLNGLTLSGTMINNGMLTLLDGVGGCNPALDITGSGTVIDKMVKVDNLVFKQRYPWNGLVDVSYEASGLLEGKTYEVRFTLTKDDVTKTFSLTNVVNGTNKYVWNAAAPDAFGEGVSNATVNVEAVIFCTSEKEKLSDYMIVDLTKLNQTGCVTYEKMTISAACEKFNTDEYKTSKMVFYWVPAGTYQVGHPDVSNNPVRQMTTAGYWVGIFKVTTDQYSYYKKTDSSYPMASVLRVTYADIRGSNVETGVPSGGLCAFLSGCKDAAGQTVGQFDLPTESQWEIACRAGATTRYSWGDAYDKSVGSAYFENGYANVGSALPNAWGIFGTASGTLERCRDAYLDTLDSSKSYYTNADICVTQADGGSSQYSSFRDWWTPGAYGYDSDTASARHQGKYDNFEWGGGDYENQGVRLICVP